MRGRGVGGRATYHRLAGNRCALLGPLCVGAGQDGHVLLADGLAGQLMAGGGLMRFWLGEVFWAMIMADVVVRAVQ